MFSKVNGQNNLSLILLVSPTVTKEVYNKLAYETKFSHIKFSEKEEKIGEKGRKQTEKIIEQNLRDNVDLSKFPKLISSLRKQNVGYKLKKSSVLNMTQVNSFLEDAKDEEFITIKVALFMTVTGACRSHERTEMFDLEIKNDIIAVNIFHNNWKLKKICYNRTKLGRKY
ncbi:hypothetical protein FQA39_LY00384 [Lamprigera yunnana]|nr:hypothetical protein FQA39_LY00384 [Lamprigera yunnana]